MSKHVSYNKLSKKAKRQIDAKARRTFDAFGCFSPVTKVIMDRKRKTDVEPVGKNNSLSKVYS